MTIKNKTISQILSGILANLREWQEQRTARASLMSLSDEMLRDIGLTRNDIDAAVCGRVNRHAGNADNVVAFSNNNPALETNEEALRKAA